MVQRQRLDPDFHERFELCVVNVGGWTPAFENFVQVVVVVLGFRVFASEACFTLGSHSSMVKLVVSLSGGGCQHLHTLRRRFCDAGCFAGAGFSRAPGHRHLFVCLRPWSLGGRGEMAMALLAHCLPHAARRRQSLSLSLHACTVVVMGAAGHNRWGVVEMGLPAKTQGRTGDCTFFFFFFASSACRFLFQGAV